MGKGTSNHMQPILKSLMAIVTLSFLSACAGPGQFRWPDVNPFSGEAMLKNEKIDSQVSPLRIVFTSNVMGEVEPCGCAVGPKGGLDRRLNFIDLKLKKEEKLWPYLLIDAGNSILATTRIDAARKKSYQKVAKELLKAHAVMGVQAQNVGYLDLGFGVDFLKAAAKEGGLPLVSASWVDDAGKLLFEDSKIIKVGSHNVLITGITAGFGEQSSQKVKMPVEALKAVFKKHADHTGPIVVMSDLGLIADEKLALDNSLKGKAIIFVGSRDLGGLSMPKQNRSALHVQSEFRGQQWGVLDLKFAQNSKQWVYSKKLNELESRWSKLEARRLREKEKLKRSRDWKLEEARLANTARDLISYAPRKDGHNSFYDYELINLDFRYQGRNRMTSKMNYLVEIKK